MFHISPTECVGAVMYTWYVHATGKGAEQMTYRQSDGRIVPVKARNSS